MANIVDTQVSVEGERNVVVKLTGILDSSNVIEVPAFSLADCHKGNELLTLTGFRIDLIEWAIGGGIEVSLAWNGTAPQQIFPLSGRGRIQATNYGGYIPDMTRAGYDGSIILTTRNFVPGVDGQGQPAVQMFTITLELIKLYKQ